MDIWKRVRVLLAVFAAATLLILLIVPATSWRVRGQILTSLGLHVSQFPSTNKRRQLREHPNDYQMQLAAAFWPAEERLPRLRSLESRFPNNPSLYACILGCAMRDEIRLQRGEASLYDGQRQPDFSIAPKPASPAQLAVFDREAATGERLDPDNAYFPLMRAIGFFAAHRDKEALTSIHRAAMLPRWADYTEDKIRGDWRLTGNASRTSSAFLRYVQSQQTVSQYLQMNDATRVAVYLAERDELAGDTRAGLAIRLDLLRCAGLMRAQSTSLTGSIIGTGIARTALVRPGGIQPAKDPAHLSGNEIIRNRLSAFCAYLAHIGHGEAIGPASAEIEAGQRVKAISEQVFSRNLMTSDYSAYLHWWAADLAACANMIWLLLLGTFAALFSRSQQIRAWERMPNHARWGILSGILFGAAGLVWMSKPLWVSKPAALNQIIPLLFPDDSGPYVAPPIAGIAAGFLVCAICALICLWLSTRRSSRESIQGLGFSLLTAAVLLVIGLMANAGASTLTQLVLMWKTDPWGRGGLSNGMAHVVSVLAVLAIPIAALLAAGVYSLWRRIPLSSGLVRGARQAALPMACAVMLLYGGMTVATVRLEERINDNLEQIVRHEGRYYAARIGQPWPGLTNWTGISMDGGERPRARPRS